MVVTSGMAAGGWTDRREYDEVLAIRSEATPQKRLELLNQWSQNYPKSALAMARNALYLSTYESLGDSAHMLDASRAILSLQPDSAVGLYWSTVLIPLSANPKPQLLDDAAKSARKLLAGANGVVSGAGAGADQQKEKAGIEVLAHRALGWIEWQRGNYTEAEKELRAGLQVDPKNGELTEWLGVVLALQKEKVVPGLWQLSRAGSLRESGALPDEQRLRVNALTERIYISYHGAADGLDQLRDGAAKAAATPDGFNIESAAVIAARRMDEEMERKDPQLFAWIKIKRELDGEKGQRYFEGILQTEPLPKLRGTVIKCTPETRPTEVVVGLTNGVTEEATLKVSPALKNGAEIGTVIEFDAGSAVAFQKDPFNLTVQLDPAKITGWPEKGPARKK
jgi:hypothetical protein